MFFPRLRRRAKWVFLFLALAFAFGFVAFGVGAGGSGIGDYFADLLNRQPGTGQPSVDEARERVRENPTDPAAQLALATALQTDGRNDEAIKALEAYTKMKPGDTDALQQLASLYLVEAGEAEQRARAAQTESAQAYFGNELQAPEGKLAEGLGTAPITEYVRQQSTQEYTAAFSAAQAAHAKEAEVWKKLTRANPEEASYFFELGRASQQSGDFKGAATAYERYLRLSPDATDADQIRALVKELKKQAARGVTPGIP